MDIDPMESANSAEEAADTPAVGEHLSANARLSTVVAVTVAILATFMGICKVKDDNIVQAMQQAQADKIDHWAFYQARNLRQEIAEATAVQLELARQSLPNAPAAGYDAAIAKYRALAQDMAKKKDELRMRAEADQARYD